MAADQVVEQLILAGTGEVDTILGVGRDQVGGDQVVLGAGLQGDPILGVPQGVKAVIRDADGVTFG